MTAPTFMDCEAAYLPKNKLIKQETLPTEDYLVHFDPFDKPEIKKRGVESRWDVSGAVQGLGAHILHIHLLLRRL